MLNRCSVYHSTSFSVSQASSSSLFHCLSLSLLLSPCPHCLSLFLFPCTFNFNVTQIPKYKSIQPNFSKLIHISYPDLRYIYIYIYKTCQLQFSLCPYLKSCVHLQVTGADSSSLSPGRDERWSEDDGDSRPAIRTLSPSHLCIASFFLLLCFFPHFLVASLSLSLPLFF